MTTARESTMKRLNADIDKHLHLQFKMACLSREENMTDVLTAFIEKYVAITSKQKGKQ